MIAFGLMLALAGIIILIIGVAQAIQNRSYAASSETVSGTVIGKRKHHRKNGTSYELTVSYTVDGVSYERVVATSLTDYDAIFEGDRIELLYKPNHPKRVVRPTVLNPKHVRILLILGAAMLVVGVFLLFSQRIF